MGSIYMDNSLVHIGILGMKWGQRKPRRVVTTTDTHTKLTSQRFRPVIVKEKTTRKIIYRPRKEEVDKVYKELRDKRIKDIKDSYKTAAAVLSVYGVLTVAGLLAQNYS